MGTLLRKQGQKSMSYLTENKPVYDATDGMTLKLLNLATTMIGYSKTAIDVDNAYSCATDALSRLKYCPQPSDEDLEKLRTFARGYADLLEGE